MQWSKLHWTAVSQIFNIVSMILVGVFFLGSLCVVVGAFVGFRIARSRAARLQCPYCKRPIGHRAVKIAADLQRERETAFVRDLNLQENECVDIHFYNLLPAVCPHCQTEHEFDLDELGIGPL